MKINYRQTNGYTYSYDAPRYLNTYSTSTVVSLNYVSISSNGASSNRSFRQSLLGSIGEAYERQTLINFFNCGIEEKIIFTCVNLLTRKVVELPNTAYIRNYFYDTCGLSTHLTTNKCIENSLKEFIERQSFIVSYLSKTKGKIIERNKYFFDIVPEEFHFLEFYEISLIESYNVVFCIGKKDDQSIDIGLGAGYTIEEALNNVMKEVKPFSEKHKKIPVQKGQNLDYVHIYHLLPIEKIISAYDYLKGGEVFIPKPVQKKTRKDVLIELSSRYKMNLLACSIFSPNNSFFRNSYSKNIKIFSIDWFSSLNLSKVTEDIYKNVEQLTGLSLDRNSNFIPFP